MNLLKFAVGAGRRVGLGKGKAEDKAALEKEIADLGLPSEGVEIDVEGDKVTVSGEAVSQEAREKILLAVGNVEGVAQVEDATSVKNDEPAAAMHVVEKGDTLWAIAKAHYGDGAKYPMIFEANRPMLSDPDRIYPGQVLRVPPLA